MKFPSVVLQFYKPFKNLVGKYRGNSVEKLEGRDLEHIKEHRESEKIEEVQSLDVTVADGESVDDFLSQVVNSEKTENHVPPSIEKSPADSVRLSAPITKSIPSVMNTENESMMIKETDSSKNESNYAGFNGSNHSTKISSAQGSMMLQDEESANNYQNEKLALELPTVSEEYIGNNSTESVESKIAELDEISLIDIVNMPGVSVRLRNCVREAMDDHRFPYRTVADYLRSGNAAYKATLALPNMGVKSVREFEDLLKNIQGTGNSETLAAQGINISSEDYEDILSLRISELVEINYTSERLRNSIKTAADSGVLTLVTIKDYLSAGSRAIGTMLMLSDFGKKTAVELDGLVKNLVSKTIQNTDWDSNASSVPQLKMGHVATRIADDIALLRLEEIVEDNLTSERLRNSIRSAVEDHSLPIETIGDYMRAGSAAIRAIQDLPNVGKKTSIELDDLVWKIVAGFNSEQTIDIMVDGSGEVVDEETIEPSSNLASSGIDGLLKKFQGTISEREYWVLKSRGIDGRTLEDTGTECGVTRERIRQIEKNSKMKLLRVYRDPFDRLIEKIVEMLDESYGELELSGAAKALNLPPEVLEMLIYICSDKSSVSFRAQNGHLSLIALDLNYSEWNDSIDEILYSLMWPIEMGEIDAANLEIPKSYIKRYLENNRGAIIENNTIIQLEKIPQTMRLVYVLREAGGPLDAAQIAREYKVMFGESISEHNAQSTVARMEEALIVGRGLYSLYETMHATDEIVTMVRHRSYDYLMEKGEYVSSKIVYKDLFENRPEFLEIYNAYIVHGILQDDTRFSIRRGLMVGIKEHAGFVEFKSLTDEVHDIVGDYTGPLSISDIKKLISDRRKVLDISIRQILEGSKTIIRIKPGLYDTISNAIGGASVYENLLLAIKISLGGQKQGLFQLTNNIRSVIMFDSLDINKTLIASIAGKMEQVAISDHHYMLDSIEDRLDAYIRTTEDLFIQGKSQYEVEKKMENLLGIELSQKYYAADYRMQSSGYKGGKSDMKSSSSSEINSILSAFDF